MISGWIALFTFSPVGVCVPCFTLPKVPFPFVLPEIRKNKRFKSKKQKWIASGCLNTLPTVKFPICLYSIFSFLAGGAGVGAAALSFLAVWLSVLVAAVASAGFAYTGAVAVFGSPWPLPPAVVEAISVDLPNY